MFNIDMERLLKACLLLVCCFGVTGAQEQLLKTFDNQNIGEATLVKQTMFADASGVGTTYYISVPKEADYYLSTVTSGVEGKEYDVSIDGKKFVEGKVKLGNGWKAGLMVDGSMNGAEKTIHLTKGNHVVSFTGKGPEVPIIDKIRIAQKSTDALLSAADLVAWTRTLSAKTMSADYAAKKAAGATALAAAAYTSGPQDPALYQYDGTTGLTITTTTCLQVYISAGTSANFWTSGSTVDPVMYVFANSDPTVFSQCNDDYKTSIESKIAFTAPKSDNYVVVLRSYYSGQTGSTTIYYNGAVLLSGAPIGGTMVTLYSPAVSGVANYFTCKPEEGAYTTDTRLFTTTGWLGGVNGYNDDYVGQGDFVWGRWSRVKLTNRDAAYCLVSRYSGTGTATCDVYAKLPVSSIPSQVPSLKADDAMKSSSASGNYNCAAWSGGITSEIITPYQDNRWKNPNNSGDKLTAFDNYYGNHPARYIGAPNYIRCDPSDAAVVVDIVGPFAHCQVRKPGNNEMHGYAWESKYNMDERLFHPRTSLGLSVSFSYKPGSLPASSMQGQIIDVNGVALTPKARSLGITGPLSLDSSVALGLTVMRNAGFTDAEKKKIAALVDKIPVSLKNEFSSRMGRWQKKWSDPKLAFLADPRDSMRAEEYVPLKNLCDSAGATVWPLLFDKTKENLPYLNIILEDAILKSSKSEMNAVTTELGGVQFTADGAYIYTSNNDRWVTLCKKLLMNRF